MFETVRDLHDLHHFSQLSLADPRGLGFADEAEKASDFIVSGITGNYEKDLEDSDAAAPGLEDNWNYKAVSSAIIDSALADPAVVDYTGVTLPDGTKEHGMYEDARLTAP